MINEPASASSDRPVERKTPASELTLDEGARVELRRHVMEVLMIEREPRYDSPDAVMMRDGILLLRPDSSLTATFEGRLLMDSETAYRKLNEAFRMLDHIPYFRERDGSHIIHAVRGRVQVKPRRIWVNVALFVATCLSLLFLGTLTAVGEIENGNPGQNIPPNPALAQRINDNLLAELWRGLPYALSLMLILGGHELGHYFAARYHKIAVTLPYFIPAPAPFFSLFGTYGAFIQQREPFRNRKVMFDIGAAGPLVGLVFAIPIVVIGLATSPVLPIPPVSTLEGNSLLYALAKTAVFGRFLPADGVDVFVNQMAWAGWAGLLVTSLNLIPLGQLDGGHILYALVGDHARRLFLPVMALMIALVLIEPSWLIWAALLFFLGRFYAPPLDMITRLDGRRRALALLSLFLFVVTFVPMPLTVVENPGTPLPRDNALWLSASVAVMFVFTRLRRH
jgi:hypothetical protein